MREHPERWRMLAYSLLQFIPIKKNRFLDRSKTILHPNNFMNFQCQCEPISHSFNLHRANDTTSYDCAEQCLNRSVNQDCLPQICPVGDGCRNRRFQLHQNAYLYPIKTSNKGWGLAAGEPIKKGQFVMQYVGEVFQEDSEIGRQRIEKYKNSTCTYMMRTENGEVIDPTTHGNIARFINHSCDPNCETRKWTVLGETSVGIFARKDIQEDEELSFDYQFDTFKTPFTRCYCGVAKCKGYLGLGVFEDDAENLNAPICAVCSKLISDNSQLLVCKGTCRHVFHLTCAFQTDKRLKAQPLMNIKKYKCKTCYYLQEGRKKPGRKSAKDLAAIAGAADDVMSAEDAQKVVKLIETDPEALRFVENTTENIMIDKVIRREINFIDNLKGESGVGFNSDSSDGRSRKKKKKKQQQYSEFYNFYFALCYRLKKRMKEDVKGFKFRKEAGESKVAQPARKARGGQIVLGFASKRGKKRTNSFQSSLSVASSILEEDLPPVRIRASTVARRLAEMEQTASIGIAENDESKKSDQSMTIQAPEPQSSQLASQNESFQSDQDSEQHQNSQSGLVSEQESEQAAEELDESEMDDEEEMEDEAIDDESEAENESMQEEEAGEDEDTPFSDEEDSDDELIQDSSDEGLSEQAEELKEKANLAPIAEEFKRYGVRTRWPQAKTLTRRIRTLKQQLPADALKAIGATATKPSTARKLSMAVKAEQDLVEVNRKRTLDQVRAMVEQFMENEQQASDESTTVSQKVNLYEAVFRAVFESNADVLECVPGLLFTWNTAWGNFVTLQITASSKQFKQLMEIVFCASNLMQRNNLLSEYVGMAPDGLSRQTTLPFLIMKILVGKNLFKKLIGYQGKTLIQYRKKYSVNFDFDETLINDIVYSTDETSPFYVFGRGRDVVKVCQMINTEVDQLYVKTFFITKEEQQFLLLNIKEVKQHIDPCEIRVKRVYKEKSESHHPFLALPNLSREVCLIGTTIELTRAEERLYELYSMRADSPDLTRTSICFLIPLLLRQEGRSIKIEMTKVFPDVQFLAIDPLFPRKHITLHLTGPWRKLMRAKDMIIKLLEPAFSRIWQPSYKTFNEFQIYTAQQEFKFCFKQLKRMQLGKSCISLTYWDVTSADVEILACHSALRVQDEQEEYTLITRLLGKEFLYRMRKILSNEIYVDPCSIFEHPDLSDQFQALSTEQRKAVIEVRKRRKFLKQIRQEAFKSTLRQILVHDQESCLNALFVLTNSAKGLQELMHTLSLKKDQIVLFAQKLIQEMLADGKYPPMSSYVKYKQTIKAQDEAELKIILRKKKRNRAMDELQRYKEYKEHERNQKEFRKRFKRSRSRDDYEQPNTFQQPSVAESQPAAPSKQAYEVINPTQSDEDHSLKRETSSVGLKIELRPDLAQRQESNDKRRMPPSAHQHESDARRPAKLPDAYRPWERHQEGKDFQIRQSESRYMTTQRQKPAEQDAREQRDRPRKSRSRSKSYADREVSRHPYQSKRDQGWPEPRTKTGYHIKQQDERQDQTKSQKSHLIRRVEEDRISDNRDGPGDSPSSGNLSLIKRKQQTQSNFSDVPPKMLSSDPQKSFRDSTSSKKNLSTRPKMLVMSKLGYEPKRHKAHTTAEKDRQAMVEAYSRDARYTSKQPARHYSATRQSPHEQETRSRWQDDSQRYSQKADKEENYQHDRQRSDERRNIAFEQSHSQPKQEEKQPARHPLESQNSYRQKEEQTHPSRDLDPERRQETHRREANLDHGGYRCEERRPHDDRKSHYKEKMSDFRPEPIRREPHITERSQQSHSELVSNSRPERREPDERRHQTNSGYNEHSHNRRMEPKAEERRPREDSRTCYSNRSSNPRLEQIKREPHVEIHYRDLSNARRPEPVRREPQAEERQHQHENRSHYQERSSERRPEPVRRDARRDDQRPVYDSHRRDDHPREPPRTSQPIQNYEPLHPYDRHHDRDSHDRYPHNRQPAPRHDDSHYHHRASQYYGDKAYDSRSTFHEKKYFESPHASRHHHR